LNILFGNGKRPNIPANVVRSRTLSVWLFNNMEGKKADKRVRRTQQALQNALLELMVERGYERLSVQHILDRADVGRATFYLHYRSKEDLLRSSLNRLRDHLANDWQSASTNKERSSIPLAFSLAFFQHIDSHRKLYRAIVGRERGAIVDKQMRRLLAEVVLKNLGSPSDRARKGSTADMTAQYVAGALMAIVTWWLDRSIKLSAEEIDHAFRQMSLPALQAIGFSPN
jgi:AcrR family transcriptional regulator